jgi:hypothetical protein
VQGLSKFVPKMRKFLVALKRLFEIRNQSSPLTLTYASLKGFEAKPVDVPGISGRNAHLCVNQFNALSMRRCLQM